MKFSINMTASPSLSAPTMTQEFREIYNRVKSAAAESAWILGSGLPESCYQCAMARELNSNRDDGDSLLWNTEQVIPVHVYRSFFVGFCRADIVYGPYPGHNEGVECNLSERGVVIECKAVKNLTDEHRAQLFAYMRWGGFHSGFLVNFSVGEPIRSCAVDVEAYGLNGIRYA